MTTIQDHELDRLIAERNIAQQQLDVAKLTIEVLKNDIAIIANALKAEAWDRGWCDDYRAFIDTVNAKCSDVHLQPCTARWRITYQVVTEVTTERLTDTERQIYGELDLVELEACEVHRTDITLVSRERVEE